VNIAKIVAKMGATDEQFCLKWNDFQQSITSTFQDLREDADFLDVTVCCDGQQVRAHKVILSACSVTFRSLLKKNPAPHPVIVLWDVKPQDLAAIMDFMYHGEVNVKQDSLNAFLSVAERLQVRGLCEKDNSSVNSRREVVRKDPGERLQAKESRVRDEGLEPERKKARKEVEVTPTVDTSRDDDIEEVPRVAVKQEMTEDVDRTEIHRGNGSHQILQQQQRLQQQQHRIAEHSQPAYNNQEMAMAVNEYEEDYGEYENEMGNYSICETGMMGDMTSISESSGKGGGFACSLCAKCFARQFNLTAHILTQHPDSPEAEMLKSNYFFAKCCDRAYFRKDRYLHHLQSKLHNSRMFK